MRLVIGKLEVSHETRSVVVLNCPWGCLGEGIGHIRVARGFCIKTRLRAQPLIWKWFFTLMQIKLIFTRKVVHLASFWKWGVLELGIGLFTPTFLRNLVPANRDFQQITIAVVDAESWGEYVTVVSQIANRRNVDFYNPAIATTPQDSFTFRTWQSVISKPVHFVIFGLFYFRPPQ